MIRVLFVLGCVCVAWVANGGRIVVPFRSDAALADGALEGTDGAGHAVAEYLLGYVSLGKVSLPIYAYWSSAKSKGASILGYGWRVPWLESCVYPVNRDCYEMVAPDGRAQLFRRNVKIKDQFGGRYGSGFRVNGRIIRFYWNLKKDKIPTFVFQDGRLVRLNHLGKVFEFVYSPVGLFEQMRQGGEIVCCLEVDRDNKDCFMIRFADGQESCFKRSSIRMCTGVMNGKPRIETHTTLSSAKIKGKEYKFSYGLAKDGLSVFSDGDRNYRWNPKSGMIEFLNDWHYRITEIDHKRRQVHFYRKNDEGIVEEYGYNPQTGMEKEERGGWRRVSRHFTSGKNLRGKLRWVENSYHQEFERRIEYAYDENGALAMTFEVDKKSGKIIETRFARSGYATYCKITKRSGGVIEHWFDFKNGKLMRTRDKGDEISICDYLYASTGEQVAIMRNGEVVNRLVPNADEFVEWYEDVKNGVKRPEPRIKTREDVLKESTKKTNFEAFIVHPDMTAFDMKSLKTADTPAKMSAALANLYGWLYQTSASQYRVDIVGQDGRIHRLNIDSAKEKSVYLDSGGWRVAQPNVMLMEKLNDLKFRVLPNGRFTKGSNEVHLAVEIYPSSAMVTIAGRVIDERGNPQSGVRVKGTFLPKSNQIVYPELWATTDKKGMYRFENLPPARPNAILSYLSRGDFGEMRGGLYEGANVLSVEARCGARVESCLISERNANPFVELVTLLRSKQNLLDRRMRGLVSNDVHPMLPRSEGNVIFAPDLVEER